MSADMTDQTRADFEAHFKLTSRQKMMRHHDGSYVYADIQAKWEGYLAGVAKAAPVADVSYEIVQDDMVVAGASGPGAEREIMHYASQYEQDGPIEIFKVTRTLLR